MAPSMANICKARARTPGAILGAVLAFMLVWVFLYEYVLNAGQDRHGGGGGVDHILALTKTTTLYVVVPGGGLTATGGIPPHVQLRLDKGLALYQGNPRAKIITLSAGAACRHCLRECCPINVPTCSSSCTIRALAMVIRRGCGSAADSPAGIVLGIVLHAQHELLRACKQCRCARDRCR